MPRADAGLQRDLDARLAEVDRQNPEWRVLTGPLREVLRAFDDSAWASAFVDPEPQGGAAPDPAGAPLLQGRTLLVPVRPLRLLVRRLAAGVGRSGTKRSLGRGRWSDDQALRLLAATVREDEGEIAALAAEVEMQAPALRTVGELASLPLFRSWGRLLRDRLPLAWTHGYCPICGGWPLLAERRGLRGTRWLRCGRCGADWEIDWPRCVYCGERDHERLGSLAPEQSEEVEVQRLSHSPGSYETMPQIDVCNRCGGYLKSIAVLQPVPHSELFLRDLHMIELDFVACERGYSRPPRSGFALEVRIEPRASRSSRPLRRGA